MSNIERYKMKKPTIYISFSIVYIFTCLNQMVLKPIISLSLYFINYDPNMVQILDTGSLII